MSTYIKIYKAHFPKEKLHERNGDKIIYIYCKDPFPVIEKSIHYPIFPVLRHAVLPFWILLPMLIQTGRIACCKTGGEIFVIIAWAEELR